MKRHPALEPFSRDHNTGLILARALQQGHEHANEDARQAWDRELRDHFDEELRLLGPLMNEGQRTRMTEEHGEIERLIASLPKDSERLGDLLHDHIRWEERELFPWIEANASPERLVDLAKATQPMETRRWETDARRKTLVSRRGR